MKFAPVKGAVFNLAAFLDCFNHEMLASYPHDLFKWEKEADGNLSRGQMELLPCLDCQQICSE